MPIGQVTGPCQDKGREPESNVSPLPKGQLKRPHDLKSPGPKKGSDETNIITLRLTFFPFYKVTKFFKR